MNKKIILMIIFTSILSIPAIDARPIYREGLPSEMIDYCKICHVQSSGLGPLNVYGKDFYDNERSIEAIAFLDSDGDGYLNQDELNNGTFPGNPESYPGARTPGLGFFSALLALLAARFFGNMNNSVR